MLDMLSKMLQDLATDEAIDACDAMYQATFRSEPYSAATLSPDDLLKLHEASQEIHAAKIGIIRPRFSSWEDDDNESHDNDHEFEQYYDAVAKIDIPYPTELTLIVELCNYKGEGEGIAMYDEAKHLPVYQSKEHSADCFNA